MIRCFFYKTGSLYSGFELSGHGEDLVDGKSLVCASVSSMVQMCIIGIKDIVKLTVEIKQDSGGYLKCCLTENDDQDKIRNADLLIRTMRAGLDWLVKQGLVSVEIKISEKIKE